MNRMKQKDIIEKICTSYSNDRYRMMDILLETQNQLRCVDIPSMEIIARKLNCTRIEVEGVVSFYAFFSDKPKGQISIYFSDDIIDRQAGLKNVVRVFMEELDVGIKETSSDGRFSLDYTPCIGMCDQAPAALVNDIVLTSLTPESARSFAQKLMEGQAPKDLITAGDSPYEQITAMVANNIKETMNLLGDIEQNCALRVALSLSPEKIIDTIEKSGLRGCGGAGFATGRKWRLAADEKTEKRYIICNADEGEPGTFKDRVLLTERPDLVFEGMTIAAKAINASEGILYLRGEYVYLRNYLEGVLQIRRDQGLLGNAIDGQFNFDIRIQSGAGAYICGEESALINSCEGLPGEPKTRPPFPVQQGYMGKPTVVNNVETFCHAANIFTLGIDEFNALGTKQSHGTKLMSVSGDCDAPGVYELPYGFTILELLKKAGAHDPAAVQVGGPSGQMIGRNEFDRRICFEDLSTGGAFIIFSSYRNVLEIVDYYLSFFVDESCGFCTPCRVGNVFLQKGIARIRKGQAERSDIEALQQLADTIIKTSRCGLGQTSPNPLLSSIQNFPLIYAALMTECEDGMQASFNIQSALDGSRRLARHRSYIYDPDFSED